MCQKESWGAIFETKEAHSTQRGQPPRRHGPGLWRYEQKEQRVTPVPMSGVNCDLWCPECDSKDSLAPWRDYCMARHKLSYALYKHLSSCLEGVLYNSLDRYIYIHIYRQIDK